MTWPRVFGLALTLALPAPAFAGRVCPPTSLDEPLPGVAEVTVHEAGVSTARFPGQWQEGEYGGAKYAYRLFVDGSGTVGDDLRLRGWHVDFSCDLTARRCTYTSSASPPAKAVEAARAIGACLTATPPRARERPVRLAVEVARAASKPRQDAPPAPATSDAESAAGKRATTGTPSMVAKPSDDPGTREVSGSAPNLQKPIAGANPAPAGPLPASATTSPLPQKPANAQAGPAPRASDSDSAYAATAVATAPPLPACLPYQRGTVPVAQSPACPAPSRPEAAGHCGSAASCGMPDDVTDPPCWVDLMPEEPTAARLQRMLLFAGFDAGPVDGKPGVRTHAALVRALGSAGADAPEAQILAALHSLVCRKTDVR